MFLKLIFEADDEKWTQSGFPAHPSEVVFHHAANRDFHALYTLPMLLELLQKFQDYDMDREAAEAVIGMLRTFAEEAVMPTPLKNYCADKKDDKFIHCAVHGNCSHLVTFDKVVYRAVSGDAFPFCCERPVAFIRELKAGARRHKAALTPFTTGLGLSKVPSEVDRRRAARAEAKASAEQRPKLVS